jgi:hypothetical protein
MPRILGVLALAFTLIAGFVTPASAEFFGCDDQHASRSSSYSRSSYTRSYTHDFAAQKHTRHSSPRRMTVSQSWSDRGR